MKIILLLLAIWTFSGFGQFCPTQIRAVGQRPERLVVISGKVTFQNHPDLGNAPATSETVIFQKEGCQQCFIGSNVDAHGNYKILVADGKYELMVLDPGSGRSLLAPDQVRTIDTGSANSPKQEFKLDVELVVRN